MSAAKPFQLVAHRGDKTNAPENTLAAFRRACEIECEAIELDVHLTRDGELVVIHDGTLDRTTSGSGPVADHTLAEVRRLEAGSWFSPEFGGEPIPTLAEALGAVAGRRILVVEMKDPPKDSDRAEQAVLSDLRNGGALESSLVISFDWQSVENVQRLAPQANVSLLGTNGPALLEAARQRGAGRMSLLHTACTEELMKAAAASGVWVNAWTVNEEEQMRRLVALGVDSIASDRPTDMAEWRRRLTA
jgi:glycerophosphoryl diester phosphodiesterase